MKGCLTGYNKGSFLFRAEVRSLLLDNIALVCHVGIKSFCLVLERAHRHTFGFEASTVTWFFPSSCLLLCGLQRIVWAVTALVIFINGYVLLEFFIAEVKGLVSGIMACIGALAYLAFILYLISHGGRLPTNFFSQMRSNGFAQLKSWSHTPSSLEGNRTIDAYCAKKAFWQNRVVLTIHITSNDVHGHSKNQGCHASLKAFGGRLHCQHLTDLSRWSMWIIFCLTYNRSVKFVSKRQCGDWSTGFF